jgi:4-hydroxy-tetrahydrodipicolinate synthase
MASSNPDQYHPGHVPIGFLAVKLTGSLCALATPFRESAGSAGALDLDSMGRLIDFQIESGTAGLVVAGSTGEAAALGEDEFSNLVGFAADRVAGRVPVLAGTGLQSTSKTIAHTRRARDAGADLALVVVPPYVRATQEGLYRHFSTVAESGGLPVVLYNVPVRTAADLLPATATRLAAHGNIVGIKEAVADPQRMRLLARLEAPSFSVLSGDDATWLRALRAGASGVISVAANVAPREMAALHRLQVSGDVAAADRLDLVLQELHAVLGIEPNPTPVKWCLAQLGFGSPVPREPLLPLSKEFHERARSALARVARIEAGRAVG